MHNGCHATTKLASWDIGNHLIVLCFSQVYIRQMENTGSLRFRLQEMEQVATFGGRSNRSRKGLSGCRSDKQARYSGLALVLQEILLAQRSTTRVRWQRLRFHGRTLDVFDSIIAEVRIHP